MKSLVVANICGEPLQKHLVEFSHPRPIRIAVRRWITSATSEFSLLVLFFGSFVCKHTSESAGSHQPGLLREIEVKKNIPGAPAPVSSRGPRSCARMKSRNIRQRRPGSSGIAARSHTIKKKVGFVRKCAYASRDARPPARAFWAVNLTAGPEDSTLMRLLPLKASGRISPLT